MADDEVTPEELAQIAADGFNSIILAVPGGNFSLRPVPYPMRITRGQNWTALMEMAWRPEDLGVSPCGGTLSWIIAGSDMV